MSNYRYHGKRVPVRDRTMVCSFWHDHPAGDPSYDDCELAAARIRADLASRPVCGNRLCPCATTLHSDGAPLCGYCATRA